MHVKGLFPHLEFEMPDTHSGVQRRKPVTPDWNWDLRAHENVVLNQKTAGRLRVRPRLFALENGLTLFEQAV
jgi:hypothetical protein